MMRKGDFARENGVAVTNDRTGRAAMVRLTKRSLSRDLIKLGSETVNFVN